MEGVSRTLGIGPSIEMGGKKYIIRAKIIEDLGMIEAEIIKKRGNPFHMVRDASESLKDHPDVLKDVVSDLMYQAKNWNYVERSELFRFIYESHDGFIFCLWRCMVRDAPELTREDVNKLYADEFQKRLKSGGDAGAAEFRAELESAMQQAEGEDEMGNSTGSSSGAGKKSRRAGKGSIGTKSGSSSSEAATDSLPPTSGS